MKKYAIVKPLDLIPYKPNQHWIYHPKYLQLGLQNNPNRIWRSQIYHNTGIGSFSQDPHWFLKEKLNKTFYQTDRKTWQVQISRNPDFDCRIKIETLWAYEITYIGASAFWKFELPLTEHHYFCLWIEVKLWNHQWNCLEISICGKIKWIDWHPYFC